MSKNIEQEKGRRQRERWREINNFIKVWVTVSLSLCYCYFVAKIVPKGAIRLVSFIAVVSLFLILPLNPHTMHLGGSSAFFIAWLANFKLLMFAFNKGPLSDPSVSLPHFIAIACLPIKIRQNTSQLLNGNPNTKENPNPPPKTSKKGQKSILNYATKVLLIALLVRIYDYSDYIHSKIMLVLFSFHIYFGLEIILAISAAMARILLGFELEPQFDDPYLSTSLQDFWGRRWNMMVSRILRPSVYDPTLSFSTRILGRKRAPLPAVFSTFFVSALMHELIFCYLGRVWPTLEITWFFLLHGVSLMAEIAIKKAINGRCRLPPLITCPLTIVFVMVTGFWLFFPPLLRCKADVRALEEYAAVGAFLKDIGESVNFKSFTPTRTL